MNATSAALRPPSEEYTGPPKEWFLAEQWHERDLEAIFRPRWLVAGHVDELETGARGHGYLTFSLGAEEVLIRAGEDGRLHGWHNVCPHRGAQLCQGRTGSTPSSRIVCPYHAWTYSSDDGRLLSARHMHEDFDPGAVRLKPVHVDVWKGLIFVCFADEPPAPLHDYMREATFGGFDFDGMKLAAVKSHEIRANWKIVVENNLECYHCTVIHPELSVVFDWRYGAKEDFEAEMAGRAAGREVMEATYETPLSIGGERVCAVPSPRSDGETDPRSYFLLWEPGVGLTVSRDSGWIFVPKPIAPDRTELRQYWLVAEGAEEGRDYEIENLKRFWDTTMLQDREACEAVQHGMRMPAYEPGPLNRVHQGGQAGFFAWYTEQIRARYPEAAEQLVSQA